MFGLVVVPDTSTAGDGAVWAKRQVAADVQKQLVRPLNAVMTGHHTLVPLAAAGHVTTGGVKNDVGKEYTALPAGSTAMLARAHCSCAPGGDAVQ